MALLFFMGATGVFTFDSSIMKEPQSSNHASVVTLIEIWTDMIVQQGKN